MSRRQRVISYVNTIPVTEEITSTRIAREMGEDISRVSAVIGELRNDGKLHKIREEAGEGGKRLRYVYMRAPKIKSSFTSSLLSSISDIELIAEVKRRMA